MKIKNVAVLAIFLVTIAITSSPSHARGGGAANLLNSPGYQRAQKLARENYLRQYYGEQRVQVARKKYRRHRS